MGSRIKPKRPEASRPAPRTAQTRVTRGTTINHSEARTTRQITFNHSEARLTRGPLKNHSEILLG